jgi:hypothetical protein
MLKNCNKRYSEGINWSGWGEGLPRSIHRRHNGSDFDSVGSVRIGIENGCLKIATETKTKIAIFR